MIMNAMHFQLPVHFLFVLIAEMEFVKTGRVNAIVQMTAKRNKLAQTQTVEKIFMNLEYARIGEETILINV